jgi:hypothetical protein
MEKSGENSGDGWLEGFRGKVVEMVIAAYTRARLSKKRSTWGRRRHRHPKLSSSPDVGRARATKSVSRKV